MDRSSFIQQTNWKLSEDNQCGEMDCVCIETNISQRQILNKASSLQLVTISVVGFLCAFVFSEYKSHASIIKTDKWLLEKKAFVIACNSVSNQEKGTRNDQQPYRNSENSCSHQQAAVISKRRYVKFFNC
jgi:hypothetical protein